MNVRLQTLVGDAESLSEAEQDRLAEFMELYLVSRTKPDLFTPEELAGIDRLLAQPRNPVDPATIEEIFARRG